MGITDILAEHMSVGATPTLPDSILTLRPSSTMYTPVSRMTDSLMLHCGIVKEG